MKKYGYHSRYVLKGGALFLKKNDPRWKDYMEFKKRHGFSPDEIWSLEESQAIFMFPRLRYYRIHTPGSWPADIKKYETWKKMLDDMIFMFEQMAGGNSYFPDDEKLERLGMTKDEYMKRMRRGKRLFGKYWTGLWC